MGVLLFIVGFVVCIIIGAVICGLTVGDSLNFEDRVGYIVAWPIFLLFFSVFQLLRAADWLARIVTNFTAASKKRIMERFREEE